MMPQPMWWLRSRESPSKISGRSKALVLGVGEAWFATDENAWLVAAVVTVASVTTFLVSVLLAWLVWLHAGS